MPQSVLSSSNFPHFTVSSGFRYGLLSALFYSLSAIFVRQLTELHSPYALSICLRESFAAFTALPFIIIGLCKGTIPSNQWRFWGLLFLVSSVMQILGNMTYFWLFDTAGIAVALACIWTGGLITAQLYDYFGLKEKFSFRTFIGLIIILGAVCFIGFGLGQTPGRQGTLCVEGARMACMVILGGLLVGVTNSSAMAAVRFAHKNAVPFWVPVLLVPGSGAVVLGIWSLMEHGCAVTTVLTSEQMFYIALSGLANLAAFLLLVKGLFGSGLALMNLMNASQVAFGAVAGIFWFSEPSNVYLITGIILTVIAVLTAK